MGTLNSSQFSNDFTMALSHFLIAFLALGLVAAEEMEFEEGLSADEILNMEFPVEYSNYYRWPKAIIPYKIARGFSSSQINTIYAGMKMWMRKTCIRFVQAGSAEARSTGHNHYITIFSGQGCYSSVGYNHRSHQVSLQAGGCTYAGIVAHELGHTIGLHHEQCRPDRDNYLNIFLNNVPSNMRFNF